MKYEKAKDVVIVWEFFNEYWEEFKIIFCTKPWYWKNYPVLHITGDEFDWELVELAIIWARDSYSVIATNKWFTWRFLFSREENLEIIKIVKNFNPDIINWIMNPNIK